MIPGIFVSVVLLAGSLQGATPTSADRPVKERLRLLRKQLSSREEAVRIEAVRELGEIRVAEARSLLVRKMASDTEAVRLEAGRAIVNHRHPFCIQALGNAIQACGADALMATRFVKLLGDLDMCVAIPMLVRVVERSPESREEAIGALLRIGCPDAVPGLVRFLHGAEKEELKPEVVMDRNPITGRAQQFRNTTKDRALASWAPRIRKALTRLTGRTYPGYEAWARALASGALVRPLASVYLCTETGKEFEIAAGKKRVCPYGKRTTPGGPASRPRVKVTRHENRFLKHLRP